MTVTIAGTTGTTQPTATCTTNLVLTGSSSGTTTVQAAATASGTITVPAGTGTLAVNGVSSNIVTGTPTSIVNGSTSTTITGVPSWAKRVIVNGIGVTKAGTSTLQLIQIGPSGGVATSGYAAASWLNASYISNSTAGFPVTITVNGTTAYSWMMTLNLVNASTNQWQISGTTYDNTNFYNFSSAGYVSLSGALSQVRIISSTSTDTFSAGTVNVSWE